MNPSASPVHTFHIISIGLLSLARSLPRRRFFRFSDGVSEHFGQLATADTHGSHLNESWSVDTASEFDDYRIERFQYLAVVVVHYLFQLVFHPGHALFHGGGGGPLNGLGTGDSFDFPQDPLVGHLAPLGLLR